jgi:cytidine deaminase
MTNKEIKIAYQEFEAPEQMEAHDRKLVEAAIEAMSGSYAPYSNFNVGAAVRMGNGEIVTGSNQENAASPSGLCAERVALFAAHHNYPSSPVKAIAIVGSQGGNLTSTLTYPCAACIQVMVESQKRAGAPIAVIIGSAGKIQVMESIDALLPFSFSSF